MIISKFNNKLKLGISVIASLLILFSLAPVAKANTVIEDSVVPVKEDDSYTWFCIDSKYPSEVGGWYNLTIEHIYQNSYMSIPHALIINATYGAYAKDSDTHLSNNHPEFLIYNASLDYFQCTIPMIFPVPFSISMVKDWFEAVITNSCTIVGNTLIDEKAIDAGFVVYYTYNTEGLLTIIKSFQDGDIRIVYSLDGSDNQIPFGDYYITISFLAVASIVFYTSKKITS